MKNLTLLAVVILISLSSQSFAQEIQTLMGPDTDISFVWGLDLNTATIKDELGTEYNVYGGALFNRSILLGLTAGLNLTHPKLNQGYLGVIGQYTYKPEKVIHYSGFLKMGTGSAKGYPAIKSSALDNMGNITGPSFYLIEPGINVEINMTPESRLLIGVSYRSVSGLDEISFTQRGQYYEGDGVDYTFTDEDLSGLYFNIGFKVGLY